jgi:glycosyltransferase involved in cell wall biosynthesis
VAVGGQHAIDALVVTEQRCWIDDRGMTLGRKSLTALSSMAAVVDCTLAARPSPRDDGHDQVLPRQSGHLSLEWPDSLREVRRAGVAVAQLWTTIGRHRAVVVYAPGVVGALAGLVALVRRRALVVVAVGDPREALAPEMFPGPWGRVLRLVMSQSMSTLCRRAEIVRYVTRQTLQHRYPPGPTTLTFGATDVGDLRRGQVRSLPRDRRVRILTVASLEQPYKGVAELIRAVAMLVDGGHDVELRVAGTGRQRELLERLGAQELADRIHFMGHLSREDLDEAYEHADCFVLASWTEGLPRGLLEAMASGLPCVATAVGGVPELLEPDRMVPPRRPEALAAALEDLLADPLRWQRSSETNLRTADQVGAEALLVDREFATACGDVINVVNAR